MQPSWPLPRPRSGCSGSSGSGLGRTASLDAGALHVGRLGAASVAIDSSSRRTGSGGGRRREAAASGRCELAQRMDAVLHNHQHLKEGGGHPGGHAWPRRRAVQAVRARYVLAARGRRAPGATLDRMWPIIVGFSRIAGSCARRLPIEARSACQTRQKRKVGRRTLALHTPNTAEEAGDRTASMLKLGAAAWVCGWYGLRLS